MIVLILLNEPQVCVFLVLSEMRYLLIVCLEIKFVSGSVEAACALGLADAVIDLVETGTTMRVEFISFRFITILT